MNIESLKDELFRTVRVLGKHKAECQNYTDITQWLTDGLITDNEAKLLHKINREITR